MTNTISNADDVIDSRDIIARIEELQGECEDRGGEMVHPDEDGQTELAALLALQSEAEGYAPDWRHGCGLIRDSHFKDYAEELAEDCGMIQAGATWPNNCIDWDEASRQLKMDYTSVEFDGVTYWVR